MVPGESLYVKNKLAQKLKIYQTLSHRPGIKLWKVDGNHGNKSMTFFFFLGQAFHVPGTHCFTLMIAHDFVAALYKAFLFKGDYPSLLNDKKTSD